MAVVYITIHDPKLLHTYAMLVDIYRRVVRKVELQYTSQALLLEGLHDGIYMLKLENGRALKLVKD